MEIKDYNVKINGRKLFDYNSDTITYDCLINSDTITYENRKIATGQGDYFTTDCLLDYHYFKERRLLKYHKDKQQIVNADPRTIQQIIFT